jgi:enhancing lycopene biosynthesis protein 2
VQVLFYFVSQREMVEHMAESDNLVLEHLRAIRGDIAKLATRMDNLVTEQRIANGHISALVHSDVHKAGRLSELEVRIERVERRLEIVE